MADNYKSCPLKKRPVVYEKDVNQFLQEDFNGDCEQKEALALIKNSGLGDCKEKPEDLSLKRKSSDTHKVYAFRAKRECALNLSNKSSSAPCQPRTVQDLSGSSLALTPACELDCILADRQNDIHLRGLTFATSAYTTNPYRSAFVAAAGCNLMPGVWNTYQPNVAAIFPSPASSIASAKSPSSAYSYHHITPPSSPSSEVNSEPEDLSVRTDIPLPALYHLFDEVPEHKLANSIYSRNTSTKVTSSSTDTNKNCRFKCDKCNKMYSTSMGLNKHEQFHCPATERNQEKKQHACQDCGKAYNTMGALKMHIRTHTLPCKCPICGKAFSRPWLLQGHIRTHTGEKPFQCHDCPRSFADRSNLRAHQQTHVEVKKYACKLCHKSFSRMSLLNKHASSSCTITIM